MDRHATTMASATSGATTTKGGFVVKRLLASLFSVALIMGVAPAAFAHSSSDDLSLSITKAPVAPDGTTAGAAVDFVVSFVDPNPNIDGIGMKTGGTIEIELDDEFDLTGNQGTTGPGPGQGVAILQGWPQSPLVTFPYTTEIDGNTITLTMTADWAVGDFGPGPKAVHLALFESVNPDAGRYEVEIEIQPDPSSSRTLSGERRMRILKNVRPSINVISVKSGPPGPPPPFFNPLYQDVELGGSGRQVGMYLWDRSGSPAIGVDVEMVNARHGHLVQEGKIIGSVRIRAPHGARNQTLVSAGASVEEPAVVSGIATGVIITTFTPDPAVEGHYRVTFRMNGGNSQTMRYNVTD
ncbi:MAG: hypothetical protein BMS9Abin17_0319 [Acidimicrobiia bacterium]|nr:MAG: hypothetical protein BMS9Abin17_0319 [Acidimicrobiia bacterium]